MTPETYADLIAEAEHYYTDDAYRESLPWSECPCGCGEPDPCEDLDVPQPPEVP